MFHAEQSQPVTGTTTNVPSWLPTAMSGLRSSVEEAQRHMQAAAEEQKQVYIYGRTDGREGERIELGFGQATSEGFTFVINRTPRCQAGSAWTSSPQGER